MCNVEFSVSSPMPAMASTAPNTCGAATFLRKTSTSSSGTKITVRATRKPALEVVVVCRPNVMQVNTPSNKNPSNAPYFNVLRLMLRSRLWNKIAAKIKASPKRRAIRLNSPRVSSPIFINI
ncbi:hypothetical protein D3C75_767470 [compost metagenome]